jgi:hypothetical protein
MALLLRNVTNPKWEAPSWMAAGDVPADALTDLRADHNALSVWSVTPDDLTNLSMVLAALASNRQRLDKLDYALIDEAVLPAIPVKCVKSDGVTPHSAANGTLHRDLIELTAQKVVRIAIEMMPLKRVRVSEKQVKGLLLEALQTGVLDRNRIQPTLLNELESTTTAKQHPLR